MSSRGAAAAPPISLKGDLVAVGELLKSMPTKDDIRKMVASIEEAHKKAIQEVRAEVAHLEARANAAEEVSATVEARLEHLEKAQQTVEVQAIETRLLLEEQDDHSRRNIRIEGMPEEGEEYLHLLLQALFEIISDSPEPVSLKRAYRLTGARTADPSIPRDVVCRLLFTDRENLISASLASGPI